MTHKPYDEDFKKSIVALHQNGKTQTQLAKEYGVSLSASGKWIRQYISFAFSTVSSFFASS